MIRLYALYLPLLLILASVPMVMQRVPPNGFYGFRTPKTLSNSQIWYRANRLAGLNTIVGAAIAMLSCWVIVWCLGATKALVLIPLVLLLAVLGSAAVSLLQLRKM